MGDRLWLKLMGTFALVIVVGVAVTVILARQGAASQVTHVMLGPQMIDPAELQAAVEAYYVQHNGWEGLDAALNGLAPGGASNGMMGGMMGAFDGRIRVIDAQGAVVADSAGVPGGMAERPPAGQAWPLFAGDRQVGTLTIEGAMMNMSVAQGDALLAGVTRAVLTAALAAALVALLLGGLLVRRITRPLAQLNRASRQIAAGDLAARVPVHGQDEIGQLAETFNRMAGSLQNQETLRRRLAADIAHELRTPLTGIQGTIEALQDGVFALTPDSLNPVHEQVLLLNRLVADLRTLSLAEAGHLPLEMAPVNLYQTARRQVELFQPQALAQGVRLTLDGPEEPPEILADEQRLAQALGNLLGNALRHTPAGGRVTVQVGGDDVAVRLAVIDTGEGIAPEDVPQIFERFYRPDGSRSRQTGGSGLGLAIARRLVEAHEGRIWAQSPPPGQERGSAFYVEIPRPG